MDEKHLSTYAATACCWTSAGLGAPPTEDFPEAVLGTGALDGTQYGVPVGINSLHDHRQPGPARASTASTCPTTTTWTWDDFVEIAAEVAEASGGKVRARSRGASRTAA